MSEPRTTTDSDSDEDQQSQEASGVPPGYATHRRDGLENAARIAAGAGGNTTLFQPGSLLEEDEESAADASSTQVLHGDALPPSLPDGAAPYFLRVGAQAGEERISIQHARTTFGRDRGDVRLNDSAVSGLHFQLDVVGREYFIRDLGSRNGTRLNGHPVRYSEILAGDEIRAGETALIFRVEGDGLSKAKAP